MTIKYADLVAKTQGQLDSDVDFQNSIVDLSEEDKQQAISDKQQELLDSELSAIEEKATKAEEIAKNQKIRAEKAEAQAKGAKVEKETPKNDLDIKDIRALQDVPDEDVDEVLEYAKFKGIPVAEAKKSPVIQTLLKTKADERKTSQAIQTGAGKRFDSRNSDQALQQKIDKGELKDSEMQDAAKLVIAGWGKK